MEDLYNVDGKAELVYGRIVRFMPTGETPAHAAFNTAMSLSRFVRLLKLPGRAIGDNMGFRVHLPHRESFSPDASYYTLPSSGLRFVDGAPRFAVEVRSENDYGDKAEEEMQNKRADYFAAGTLAVWDVDLLHEPIVRLYMSNAETPVAVFHRGEIAHAGDAVPGWTMPVDELFDI